MNPARIPKQYVVCASMEMHWDTEIVAVGQHAGQER